MARSTPDNDAPGAIRRWARGIAGTWHLPLYRSSYALFLTTGANALLGLMFWVAAARLYPARIVGLGAGGIAALQLVAAVGWVGLQFTVLRYVPVAGSSRRRLVALAYGSGAIAALGATVVFTLAFASFLEVPYLADSTLHGIAFAACVVIWVIASLQDAVLVSIRRAFLVPAANATYGLLKLLLLLALAGSHDPWVLLGVWVTGSAIVAVGVNVMIFSRLLAAPGEASRLPHGSRIARFSAGHTAVALTSWVPDFLVPLLVLYYLDDAANAYYYAAWTVGFATRMLVMNMANALTAEGAYAQRAIAALLRSVIRLGATVLLPVMAVLLIGADVILQVFGARYAEEAATLLRLFAISLVPYAIATLVVAFDRVRERFGAALVITAVGTATTIALDVALIPSHGITGAGLGWLGGQTAAAVVASVTFLRARREPLLAAPLDAAALPRA